MRGKFLILAVFFGIPAVAGLAQEHGDVDGDSNRLQPAAPVAFDSVYRCGDEMLAFGESGGRAWLLHGDRTVELEPVRTASGARYEAIGDVRYSFWSRGDRALVEIEGAALPECRVLSAPEEPFTARGQEPGWRIRIDDQGINLLADYGATEIAFPSVPPRITVSGVHYRTQADERALHVSLVPRLCADVATGMPYPWTVEYRLDGEVRRGCGGNPEALLRGEEWLIDSLAGQALIEDTRISLQFLEEEGRIAGEASCNRYMGGYELDGEGIRFGQLASTSMACEPTVMEQENRFLALLGDIRRFELDDAGQLVLHSADGRQTITAYRPNR